MTLIPGWKLALNFRQLAKEPGFNADAFPSTPLITLNKFATALLEERRVALQRYFKGISHMILGHKLLIQFFGVGDASIPFIVRPIHSPQLATAVLNRSLVSLFEQLLRPLKIRY